MLTATEVQACHHLSDKDCYIGKSMVFLMLVLFLLKAATDLLLSLTDAVSSDDITAGQELDSFFKLSRHMHT